MVVRVLLEGRKMQIRADHFREKSEGERFVGGGEAACESLAL